MSKAKPPVGAPAAVPKAKAEDTSRVGKTAPWVPGHYPKTWKDFTDAELRKEGLNRPEGAEYQSTRAEPPPEPDPVPDPAERANPTEQDAS